MRVCKMCGKKITNNKLYCSVNCKDKYRYSHIIHKKKCSVCGKEFNGTKGKKVCSSECFLKAQRHKIKTCPVCHSTFNSRGNGVYCSNICYRTANNPTKGLMVATCEVCLKTFKTSKTNPELVCSDYCSSKLFSVYINRAHIDVFKTCDPKKIKKIIYKE